MDWCYSNDKKVVMEILKKTERRRTKLNFIKNSKRK